MPMAACPAAEWAEWAGWICKAVGIVRARTGGVFWRTSSARDAATLRAATSHGVCPGSQDVDIRLGIHTLLDYIQRPLQ
jgi:hypothetical protein